MQIQRAEIEGLPAFWVQTPGPLVGGLTFRVGQVDERLHNRGTTHLIEHLALEGLDDSLMFNGATGLMTTDFHARGNPAEVARFLTSVTSELAHGRADRIATEASVLKAEAAQRGNSLFGLAANRFFGARGPGLVHLPELGLENPTPAWLDTWRSAFFTRHNAAMWFAGPQPLNPQLDLDRGEARPAPEHDVVRAPGRQLLQERTSGVSLSLLLPRSTRRSTAVSALQRRLHELLRTEHGLVYGVQATHENTSATQCQLTITAECAPDRAVEVTERILTELARLRYEGGCDEELEWLRAQQERHRNDPMAAPAIANGAAERALLGLPFRQPAEHLAEAASTTPGDVIELVERLLHDALLILPGVPFADQRFAFRPDTSAWIVDQATTFTASASDDERRLLVGPTGLSVVYPGDDVLSFRWDEIDALASYNDGGRVMWSADGRCTGFHPTEWTNADGVSDLVDRSVAPHLHVPMARPLLNRTEATA